MKNWRNTLIRCLFHYSARRLQVERAFQIKNSHIPNSLYKYRKFCENHIDALSKNVLWRCSPNEFNDPYDTSVYFNVDHISIENLPLEDVIENINVVSEESISEEPRRLQDPIRVGDWQRRLSEEIISAESDSMPMIRGISETIHNISKQRSEAILSCFAEHSRREFSVVSLSQIPSSILMWSHYSDAHKGFCIEYDFSSISASDLRRRLCFPVYYRKKLTKATRYMVQYDSGNFNNSFGQYLCLLKSDEWAYEREWRIVMQTGWSHAKSQIVMPIPASIILGLRVNEGNERWMVEHCKRNEIPLMKVRQRQDAFRLEIIPHGG